MTTELNDREDIFSTIKDSSKIDRKDIICEFEEKEGITIVIQKKKADKFVLHYDYITS